MRATPETIPAHPTAADGPLLPSVRRMAWPVLGLTMANAVFLYGFGHLAESWYAWPIKPAPSAALMGAGYAMGIAGIVLTLFRVRRWASVAIPVYGFFGLSLAHVAVTLLHAQRFRWDYPLTWAWLAVYSVIPVGVIVAHWRQARQGERGERPPETLPASLRMACVALGVLTLALAVALFVVPLELARAWPWSVTPLMLRIFACWYGFVGALLLLCALARSPRGWPVSTIMLIVWNALALMVPVLHGLVLQPGLMVWLVFHAVSLLVCIWATVRAWHAMRLLHQDW